MDLLEALRQASTRRRTIRTLLAAQPGPPARVETGFTRDPPLHPKSDRWR